jgi:hypothetical protein
MSEKRSKKSKKENVKHNEEKKSKEESLEITSEKKSKKGNKEKNDTKKTTKEEKKAEKKALMEQVPKVDEDGIAYTKLQLRRMMKRVKRGLAPVPTEEEMREMIRQEAITKREEEDELAGLMHTKDDKVKTNDEESHDELDEDDADEQDYEIDHNHDDDGKAPTSAVAESNPRKRKKRSKPVPDDYVCQACQNKHVPAHWIYDCPNKETVKGTNHIAKKLRGIHAPDDTKVFVSGLAFDMKKKDVEELFRECGKITLCKLLTFEDTGRCKGQAFITFETDASAKKAIQLSGTTIKNDEPKKKKSKKGDAKEEASKRKELRLKVTRRLSRAVTKGKTAS